MKLPEQNERCERALLFVENIIAEVEKFNTTLGFFGEKDRTDALMRPIREMVLANYGIIKAAMADDECTPDRLCECGVDWLWAMTDDDQVWGRRDMQDALFLFGMAKASGQFGEMPAVETTKERER